MLKKSIGMILSVVLFLSLNLANVSATTSVNLVSDPGFELSTSFGLDENPNWSLEKGTNENVTAEVVEGGRTGKAAKISNRARAQDTLITSAVPIQRNRAYEYSVWVKTATSAQFQLEAVFSYQNAAGQTVSDWQLPTGAVKTTTTAGAWTQIKGIYVYRPSGAEFGPVTTRLHIIEFGTVTNEILLDDYSITPLVDPLIFGHEGVLASSISDKEVQYYTSMSNAESWSLDAVATSKGICINQTGKLHIPSNTSFTGDITITVSGSDYGVATTLTKNVTIGTNKINLINDPSFEESVSFTVAEARPSNPNWYIHTNSTGLVVDTISSGAHSGNKAVRLSGRTSLYNAIVNYAVPIQTNRSYEYSAWVKAPNAPTTIATVNMMLTNWTYFGNLATLSTNAWTELKGTYTYTSGTTAQFVLFGSSTNGTSPELWIDDYRITPVNVQNSVEITASSSYAIPLSGTASETLTATVNNQIGTTADVSQTVVWSLIGAPSGVTIDSSTGILNLSSDSVDGRFTVRATATEYGVTTIAEKQIEVYENVSDAVAVQRAANTLRASDISIQNLNAITNNLSLPGSGTYGTTVTWSSSNTNVVTNAGVVTRPHDYNTNVTLTATFSRGSEQANATVDICVLKIYELLGDPGFENSSSFTNNPNWVTRLYSGALTNFVSDGVDGNGKAVRISNISDKSTRIDTAQVVIQKGVEYEYSAWVKVPASAYQSTAFTLIGSFGTDGPIFFSSMFYPTADTWTKVSCKFTYKSGETGLTTAQFGVCQRGATQTITEFLVDDYSIKQAVTDDIIYETAKFYTGNDDSGFTDDGVVLLNAPIMGNIGVNNIVYAQDGQQTVTMVTAIYDKVNKQMVNCSVKTVTIAAKEITNIYDNIYCENEQYQVKVFLINGLNQLIPLRESSILD